MVKTSVEELLWCGMLGVLCVLLVFVSCNDDSAKYAVPDAAFRSDSHDAALEERIEAGLRTAFRKWGYVYNEKAHAQGALAYLDALRAFRELQREWDYEDAALKWKELRIIALKPYLDADPTASSSRAQHIHNAEIVYFGVTP